MALFNRSLLPVFFLITGHVAFAQSDEETVSRFSLGVSAGLMLNQWNLNSVESPGDSVTASSNSYVGYLGNVSGTYAFSKHCKLKMAAEVQTRKSDYRLDGLHFGQDFNGTGFNDSHIIWNSKAVILAVPVTVEYVFGTKRILPFVSLGLASEFKLKETADGTVYYSDGTTDNLSSNELAKKNNVAVVAGAGIYYAVSGKISLAVNPIFTYSLLHDDLHRYVYSFGATAGIFYNL